MYISNTPEKITHKIVMTGKVIKELMEPKQRNNHLRKGDPFFGPNPQNTNTDLLNTPDVGVYFLSTVRGMSNIINIIYPNGIVHPVDYNVVETRAFGAENHFWKSLEELNGKEPEEGLYVIYSHKLFNRINTDKMNPNLHGEYYDYYNNPSYLNNSDAEAVYRAKRTKDMPEKKFDGKTYYKDKYRGDYRDNGELIREEVLLNYRCLNNDALVRIVYFIPFKDLIAKGSIYYQELGFTVSINSLNIPLTYNNNVYHNIMTLGYNSYIEIIDNDDPHEEYYIKDVDGSIINFTSSPDINRPSGVYISTLCNGRKIRNYKRVDLDESFNYGIYKSRSEAELSNYDETDVQYKKMELSLEELKSMKFQLDHKLKEADYKLKELELKNKELEMKNRSLELQLATAKQKYKTEQLIMNCDVNKKHLELKIMEMKFRQEMERIKEEKELFKIKSTLDLVSSINKTTTEILKSRNDYVKSKRDLATSKNNNVKSAIEAGTKVVTTFASFI